MEPQSPAVTASKNQAPRTTRHGKLEETSEIPPLWVVPLFNVLALTLNDYTYSYWRWLLIDYNPGSGNFWGNLPPWFFPWMHSSIGDRTAWITGPSWGNITRNNPLLILYRMIWSSWGHSNIYIGYWCCDGLPCWIIWTERLVEWGWCTVDYECSLLSYQMTSIILYLIRSGQKGCTLSLFQ